MPLTMFSREAESSARMASRRWYTVPLSIGIHAIIVAAVIIVPLAALGSLPGSPSLVVFVGSPGTPPSPPPPAVVPISKLRSGTTVAPNAAPVRLPDAIGAETGLESSGVRTTTPDIEVGAVDTVPDLLVFTSVPVATAPPPSSPPVQAPEAEPVRVGGSIQPPTRVKGPNPVYPSIAQSARIEGVVIIDAIIGTDGKVRQARLLRSIPLLDAAALDAVRQWEYTPSLLNGRRVPVIMTVTIHFTLP